MDPSLQIAIKRQRTSLRDRLHSSLEGLASRCVEVWPDRGALEARLADGLLTIPYCKYLYGLDSRARQITANITRQGLNTAYFARDRSNRPYMVEAIAGQRFSLSEAYISRNTRRPSLTAVQRVESTEGTVLGYLGADFDLRELPYTQELYLQPNVWIQLKGDPAIRAGLFHQERAVSLMDERIDDVLAVVTELIAVHGVFHGKLHFSSSRATLWFLDDPYRYRLHGIEDLTDPDMCLAYPKRSYPHDAVVPLARVGDVFRCFNALRLMDETIYLRSGSLNIFNGLVGLNFSCDGSHYMPWDELLDKSTGFWLGTAVGHVGN
ncbi:MAG: PDC sensor domain-containing protein [Gammaproteobacteria bacterium]|jgi:hypothetical protein